MCLSSAEVVHELSSCLARTAEQQQLLHDAARLLTHGEVTMSHMRLQIPQGSSWRLVSAVPI